MPPTARPVVVASNRGPVSYTLGDDGSISQSRGGGGLVTALTGVLGATGGRWVAAAMSDGDRAVTAEAPDGRIGEPTEGAGYRLRMLSLPEEAFDRAYNTVSNRILWFAHHQLWDTPRAPRFGSGTRQAWHDYQAVNEVFAQTLDEEGHDLDDGDPAFLVQDYHLTLVPRMLRERRPDALIAHFSHTPFAGPQYLGILPATIRDPLLRGMLGADVLGFHDRQWSEAFLLCCRYLDGARVDLRRRTVDLDGRRTLVREYALGIDLPDLRALARGPEVRAQRRRMAKLRGDGKLILRVDRMELSKNVLRGFLAYREMLQAHPRWQGRARFVALMNPSRRGIQEYRAYTRECIRAAERINEELGTPEWQPIELAVRDDFPRSLAAYLEYDLLVVNPVIDGLNLVAMEGPALNRRAGALVLSHTAGAYSSLGRHAIGVNPFDIAETAEALRAGLDMPEDERRRRATGLKRIVAARTPERWVNDQLEDLERVAAGKARA